MEFLEAGSRIPCHGGESRYNLQCIVLARDYNQHGNDRFLYLREESDTLQALSLEYRHDRFNHRVMLATERLVLQYSEESVDDHRLVIIIRPRCASVADRRRDRGRSGFQFIKGLILEDEWGELNHTDIQ